MGELLLRVPDGVTIQSLCDNAVGDEMKWYYSPFLSVAWCRQSVPRGLYRLRLPVPWSNYKNVTQQRALLLPGEEVASLAVSTMALLCLRRRNHPDPLRGAWTRCTEIVDGSNVALHWVGNKLMTDVYDSDSAFGAVWMTSARHS